MLRVRELFDPRIELAAVQVLLLAGWCVAITFTSLECAAWMINVSWFGLAVFCFALYPDIAMNWVVPPHLEKEFLYVMVEGAMRFLGGMNAAMMLLSGSTLYACHWSGQHLFEQAAEKRILFYSVAVGHFSQFIINLPAFVLRFDIGRVALGRFANTGWLPHRFLRFTKCPVWPRPDQSMIFVFAFDGLFTVLNVYCAIQARDDSARSL